MCWFIGLSFTATIAFSQDVEVKNVFAAQNFNDIIVAYDLLSDNESQKYTVTLYCSTNGGKVFGDPIINAKGDVGFNVSPGEGKKIIWDVLDEFNQFVYDDVVFKVRAWANTSDFMDLVLIEGGSFTMGNASGQEDEKPAHEVQLSNFYISKYEITVKQYEEFCEKKGRNMPESNSEWRDNHPMTYVSWEDAKEYCNWLSELTGDKYRLPTEAEWEYVAEGGIYNKSTSKIETEDIDEYAWHKRNTGGFSHSEVGLLKANVLGVYDIIGNVWEWCEDWYHKDYYSFSPKLNPKGPQSGRYKVKVARGCSYDNYPESITRTVRIFVTYTKQENHIGFRVVKEP